MKMHHQCGSRDIHQADIQSMSRRTDPSTLCIHMSHLASACHRRICRYSHWRCGRAQEAIGTENCQDGTSIYFMGEHCHKKGTWWIQEDGFLLELLKYAWTFHAFSVYRTAMSMCALFVFDHSNDMFFCMCLRKRKKTSPVIMFVFLGCFWM